MHFTKLKADKLFDGEEFLQDFVLVADQDGTILSLIPASEAGSDVQELEGILCPGLVNCHCHLELSHLQNAIPEGTGLIEFLRSVVTKRDFASNIIQEAIISAEKEMFTNGVVAVGDICNTVDAIAVKQQSKIRWQNFIEVLSISDEKAPETIGRYNKILKEHIENLQPPHRSVLSPHAPYTIGKKSFELLNELTAGKIITIHNQEHPDEDLLYKSGTGGFIDLLSAFGYAQSPFSITGESSLRSWIRHFDKQMRLLLVHNTFIHSDDAIFAVQHARRNNMDLTFVLCPNANLYIENKLPPVNMLIELNCELALGTDSYSSNHQLSIAREMKTIHEALPEIPLEKIFRWATSNGARALGWDKDFGYFKKGMKPGITLVAGDLSSSKKLL